MAQVYEPIFVFLSGNGNDEKYNELVVNSIKFLKRKAKNANVGIISPAGSGDVKEIIQKRLEEADSNVNKEKLHFLEGQKHFDNGNNSQHILDIEAFTEEFDPIVFLDSTTIVLQDLLPFVENFKNSGKKFAFLKETVVEYPAFQERWESQSFIPQETFIAFRTSVLPPFLSVWENEWKEWITPAPFLNRKNPAPYHKLSVLDILKYSLSYSIGRFVKNFDEEVEVIVRDNLKICRNFSPEAQKINKAFLLAQSPYGNESVTKIVVIVESATIHQAEDSLGNGSPFVAVKVGEQRKATRSVKNTLTPVWDQELVFNNTSYADASTILFALADVGRSTSKDPVFSATLSLLDDVTYAAPGYSADAHPPAVNYSLSIVDGNGEERALLRVRAQFLVELKTETNEGGGENNAFAAAEGGATQQGTQ